MSPPLTALLGTELALVQAPMAGVQGHALAAAVCEAGGLGSVPAAMLSPQALRAELQALTARTTRPYAVNFFCHRPAAPDPGREHAWRQALAPFYAEFGLDPSQQPAAAARAPFSHALADVLEPFRPPVVSFHFGLPASDLLARVKGWGARVLSSATTLEEGRWLQAHGADAVIAQGLQAGGHRGHFLRDDLDLGGQLDTLELVQALGAALQVPVIAAGGLADAQAVAAACARGAAGVQIGTAYLLSPQATTGAVHRAALRAATPGATALTTVFTGRPARGLLNRVMRELGCLPAAAPAFPMAASALAPLRAAAEARGSGDFSPLWAGEQAAACRSADAGEITRALAAGLPAAQRRGP